MTTLGQCPHAPEVLATGADLLDGLDLEWWLSAGTVLGIHRDGALIPWDTDLDAGVVDHPGVMDAVDTAFRAGGFSPVRTMPWQRAYMLRDVVFDVYAYRLDGDDYVAFTEHGRLVEPIDALGEVEFAGRTYPMPEPVENYLRNRYGSDWSIPIRVKRPWQDDAASLG